MMARRMMMTTKKNVMSKNSLSMSPAAGSRTSAMPPPERRPWSMWYTKHCASLDRDKAVSVSKKY